MSTRILPVILCGGSGTRLWPLSRKTFAKQFIPLINGKSLLQLTLERVQSFGDTVEVVANEEHRFLVREAVEAAGVNARYILEPVGRNTAAAIAVAAINANPDQLLLFVPADHHIPDAQKFITTINQGIEIAQAGYIATFGVTPTFPSTAYGYIQQGENLGGSSYKVDRFIEKPKAETAQQLLLTGGYFWNSGILLSRADTLLLALEKHAPQISEACKLAVAKQTQDETFTWLNKEAFGVCPKESIDYAVLEQHGQVAMVPFNGQWSDVGGWNAIAELTSADENANRIYGAGRTLQSRNTYIYAPHRLVVALGTDDLLIIDTPDALLVAARSHAELVKAVVADLEEQSAPEATQHRRMARPWGAYDCVDVGDHFQVKRITVKPGAKLSLQIHHHRAEHWVVVNGAATVTRGEETFVLNENQSTYIPVGVVHSLENRGQSPLEMIEVQTGSYLGEDDIIRLEDKYGRN